MVYCAAADAATEADAPQSKMSLSKFVKETLKGPKKRNFVPITDKDIEATHNEVQNKNTKKAEKAAESQFKAYLQTQAGYSNDDCEFWDYEAAELDKHLSRFWLAVRQTEIDPETKEPKKYKVQSLRTLRYSLQRVLKEKGTNRKHEIINGESFTNSRIAFEDACKKLKEEGFGFTTPTEEILPQGI